MFLLVDDVFINMVIPNHWASYISRPIKNLGGHCIKCSGCFDESRSAGGLLGGQLVHPQHQGHEGNNLAIHIPTYLAYLSAVWITILLSIDISSFLYFYQPIYLNI